MFTYKPVDANEVYITLEDNELRITDGNSFWYYIDGWSWY